MTVTPAQLREEAQKARIDEAEAERRTAVSRSYYAAYHKCRPLAQKEGIFADVKGSHAKVIEALRRSRERKVKGFGYRLDQCRELRVKADYHIDDDFMISEAKQAKDQCDRIWAAIERLEHETPAAP